MPGCSANSSWHFGVSSWWPFWRRSGAHPGALGALLPARSNSEAKRARAGGKWHQSVTEVSSILAFLGSGSANLHPTPRWGWLECLLC